MLGKNPGTAPAVREKISTENKGPESFKNLDLRINLHVGPQLNDYLAYSGGGTGHLGAKN